jgi:hypothetical protein
MATGLNSKTHGDSAIEVATNTGSRAIAGDGMMDVLTARKRPGITTAQRATIDPTASSNNRAGDKVGDPGRHSSRAGSASLSSSDLLRTVSFL